MIDVLLVNPKERGGFFERMPPLGLAYIAANCEKHGYSAAVVDFEIEEKGLLYWLEKYQPRVVGISGTSHTRFESFKLAHETKKYDRGIITLYGGVHATFTAGDTLAHILDIDYVVRGEGEETVVNFLDALRRNAVRAVHGITFRDNGSMRQNSAAQRIEPLDSLSDPAFHLLAMKRYALDMEIVKKKGISIITSRGCSAKCSFCSASTMFNHKVTTHSPLRIVDTIEFLFNTYGFEGIKIFDSTFTMHKKHVDAFCDEIVQRRLHFPWECEIRVGTVDRAMLEKMKEAGCYYVNFGIESASQKVLNLMRKGFTVEQAEELLELCHCVGLKTKVFFSFGHIGESMDDVEKTFAFIDKHERNITTVASGAGVRIYPGTYLEDYARKHSLLPLSFTWSMLYHDERLEAILQTPCVPVLIQPQLAYDELETIALRVYGRRFGGWKGLKRGLGKIPDPEKLKKLLHLVKLRLKKRAPCVR